MICVHAGLQKTAILSSLAAATPILNTCTVHHIQVLVYACMNILEHGIQVLKCFRHFADYG